MSRKISIMVMIFLVAYTVVLAGCSQKSESASNSETPAASTPAQTSASPESATPEADDMSQKVSIRLFEGGWVGTPTGDDDPIKKWIDQKFNVDFNLDHVHTGDMESLLLTQFSANQAPDLLYITDKNTLLKLYNQGVILDDWTSKFEGMPAVSKSITETSKKYLTLDGKMIAVPVPAQKSDWSLMIRKDWLANLGLAAPKNDQELLEVLRKFTKNDPDRNGKNDTWGISSNGGGKSLGVIKALSGMYGPDGFYLTADNKVSNSIIDGTHKKFLDLMRTIVKEKLIDPDWYTQSWEQKKPKVYSDKLGVDWYPPMALIGEGSTYPGGSNAVASKWVNIEFPKASETGGKRPPEDISNGFITVSAQAAKDPVKMKRIQNILDSVFYPNEGYWALRWGVGVPGIDNKMADMGNGFKYTSSGLDTVRQKNSGLYDWGTWIVTTDNVLSLEAAEPDDTIKMVMKMNSEIESQSSFPNVEGLLNLDPQLLSYLQRLQSEFDVKYILEKENDYDAFQKKWLSQGGQKLIDQATEQFTKMGMIK
ncbi:hypothetical protein [Cohnella soli]|uniref:Extracellular solute-binding protein n=1 Tax=Cohnella soli TaxID=425005 RepID=A0ABW0HJM9_9BACL